MSSITPSTLDTLAFLSRLALTAEEKESLGGQLDEIFHWIDQLQQCSTDAMHTKEPPMHTAPLRDDIPEETPGANILLSQAPARKDDYFSIPYTMVCVSSS